MYIPSQFKEARPEEIERIISEYPLGTLVYHTASGFDATHLPFLHRKSDGENGTLFAHVARKNPIWEQVPEGSEVLVIFQGGDAYISPNWYPSKHETHKHVPTWNYQVVHVRGRIRFIHDVEALRASVAKLTDVQEARVKEAKPWTLSDGDPTYVAKLLEAIVGVEIDITQITAASKLSQNRETRDWNGVIDGLNQRGDTATAEAVEKARPDRKHE